MLQVLPFLTWLAPLVSGAMLLALWKVGELRPRALLLLLAWFGVAAFCQFGAGSPVVGAMGLLLQTLLTVYLLVRFKLGAAR